MSEIVKHEFDFIKRYLDESDIIIHGLYEKYRDDPYMLSKTRHLVCNQLSNMLDNISKTHEANELRFDEMSIEKDAFVESFLNDNRYFYSTSTESFFQYDGLHYQSIKEDDLLHTILSTISQGRQLLSWKQRTRMNIMKRIKECNILKSIPESDTIQFVLDLLYPAFFASKNEAKYFLCILGDALLKKNTNFILFLNELSNMYLGTNLYNTFKHKYHEHEYTNCRMIGVSDCIKNQILWKPLLQKYVLDILTVSSHYSIRYTSSDEFILVSSNDLELSNKIFYLHDRTHLDMIKQFVSEYLRLPRQRSGSNELSNDVLHTTSCIAQSVSQSVAQSIVPITDSTIITLSWKNMHFLWRHYLCSLNLPAIMFQQTLKPLMTEHLKEYYILDSDSFQDIFSKHLPTIQKFMNFFDETIVEDALETDFEIEELIALFKQWLSQKGESCSQLNDKQILDIIGYYYPNVVVDQDKFLHNIRCTMWDKQMDIQLAIDNMRSVLHNQNLVATTMFLDSSTNVCVNTSIYDMYIYYNKYYSSNEIMHNEIGHNEIIHNEIRRHPRIIVSKTYFDKYIMDHYTEYVLGTAMLSYQWTA